MNKIPKNFRGYAGEPQSELEVAFLLGLLYDYLPFPVVVTSINDAFPDCEGIDPESGQPKRIELEVLSKNYEKHGHPIKGCDHILCWRDNWPDSPVPVISLEDIIEENNLGGKRFLLLRKPGSLLQQLEEFKEKDFSTFETVSYFLTEALPKISRKNPHVYVDDTLTRHFNVRAADLGIFGFYPHGKLVCVTVDEFVKRYGEAVRPTAQKFRAKVIGTKVLTNKIEADAIAAALDTFLNELASLPTDSEKELYQAVFETLESIPLEKYESEEKQLQPYLQYQISEVLESQLPGEYEIKISVGGKNRPRVDLLGTNVWPDIEISKDGEPCLAVEVKLVNHNKSLTTAISETLGQCLLYKLKYKYVIGFIVNQVAGDAQYNEYDKQFEEMLKGLEFPLIIRSNP